MSMARSLGAHLNSFIIIFTSKLLTFLQFISLKVHAGNLDEKGEKNKSFKNIYIFGFSRHC